MADFDGTLNPHGELDLTSVSEFILSVVSPSENKAGAPLLILSGSGRETCFRLKEMIQSARGEEGETKHPLFLAHNNGAEVYSYDGISFLNLWTDELPPEVRGAIVDLWDRYWLDNFGQFAIEQVESHRDIWSQMFSQPELAGNWGEEQLSLMVERFKEDTESHPPIILQPGKITVAAPRRDGRHNQVVAEFEKILGSEGIEVAIRTTSNGVIDMVRQSNRESDPKLSCMLRIVERLDVPLDRVARLGDSPRPGENDHCMLSFPSGMWGYTCQGAPEGYYPGINFPINLVATEKGIQGSSIDFVPLFRQTITRLVASDYP